MSLRTRLTAIVAVIVAVAVIGGAYAAHVSAQHALQDETDKFLSERASGIVRQPPHDSGGTSATRRRTATTIATSSTTRSSRRSTATAR